MRIKQLMKALNEVVKIPETSDILYKLRDDCTYVRDNVTCRERHPQNVQLLWCPACRASDVIIRMADIARFTLTNNSNA